MEVDNFWIPHLFVKLALTLVQNVPLIQLIVQAVTLVLLAMVQMDVHVPRDIIRM